VTLRIYLSIGLVVSVGSFSGFLGGSRRSPMHGHHGSGIAGQVVVPNSSVAPLEDMLPPPPP